MLIGKNIKRLRENRNWTLYKLSKETGIAQDYLKSIEESTTENEPNTKLETLERLAYAFNVSEHEIINGDITATYLTELEQEYLTIFRRYNKEEQEAICKALDAISNKDK